MKGKNLLRVAVSKTGRATNIQSINLIDGSPVDNNNFTWNDGIIYSLMIDRFNDGDKSINKTDQERFFAYTGKLHGRRFSRYH